MHIEIRDNIPKLAEVVGNVYLQQYSPLTTNILFITIDGNQVEVQNGETVLSAARRCGVDIPTLCFDEQVPHPATSCLVCLVKINNRFVPSCATKVADGMSVESETDEVHQLRRTALELLLSDHIETCQTCGEGRKKCKLLRYMAKYKADRNKWRMNTVSERASFPADLAPADLTRAKAPSLTKCIKCGICVSLCPALTFVNRGIKLQVACVDNQGGGVDNERLSKSCPTTAFFYG